jgi:membrane protein implicated in regulation of membrane protease activity
MIADIVAGLGPWVWWIAGLILIALEVMAPGSFFVWFGIASLIVGVLALAVDISWQIELLIFVVLAVVLVVAGRYYFSLPKEQGDQPLLNERATRLIGRVYVLAEPIVDGQGRLRIDDTNWRVTGPDLPSGTSVRVTGHDGSVLSVTVSTTPA